MVTSPMLPMLIYIYIGHVKPYYYGHNSRHGHITYAASYPFTIRLYLGALILLNELMQAVYPDCHSQLRATSSSIKSPPKFSAPVGERLATWPH